MQPNNYALARASSRGEGRTCMRSIRWTASAVLLLTTFSLAQTADPSDKETIRLLVQQVKELQTKVQALELKASVNGEQASAPAPTAESEAVATPTLLQEMHDTRGIQWRGFGEVNYKVLDQRVPELGTFGFVPGSAGNFYTGEFALFLTSRINDKASVLSEIVFDEHVEHRRFPSGKR